MGQKSGWAGLVVEARWPNEVHCTERGRPRQGGAAIAEAIEAVRRGGGRVTERAVAGALRAAGHGAADADIRVAVRPRANGLAAGRPAGRTSNACGGSYPAIKIKDEAARRWQIVHLNQDAAGPWRWRAQSLRLCPCLAGSCSRRLLPGSGPCLCSCPCLGPVSLALRAAQGSPTDRHGRVGQGWTWAAHCVGLGPVLLGTHYASLRVC